MFKEPLQSFSVNIKDQIPREIHDFASVFSEEEPTNVYLINQGQEKIFNDLAEDFIRTASAESGRELWNESKMNKAMLLAYKEEQKKEKKTAAEIVPKEFHDFLSVFSDEEASRMPKHTSYDHKIDLTPDFTPITSKIFRIHPVNEKAFNDFLNENLKKGYIHKPLKDTPQAAGFFFVSKKDGRVRPCQDYRHINKYTVKSSYPLPRIDELVDSLSGMTLFCKLDIRWGYNNIRIREGDEWKASFICKRGIFEPTVMFFGLTNSPSTFQQMMDTIFAVQISQGWLKVYMDDVLMANNGD